MTFRFSIDPLSKTHDRARFQCGVEKIDTYFRQAVSQDIKRNYATCFVAQEIATGRVAGFYTLSASNIPLVEIPQDIARRLPRYPLVPAVLIGWLARDVSFRGENIGKLLLFDAIKTVMVARVGVHAVFADAVDDSAVAFYRQFGFLPLAGKPRTLFLPLAMASELLK